MHHIDKIVKLHNLLKNRRTPISGPEIERALGCSKATRQRLVDDLRDRLNAPLICNRSAGGYYYDRDDPRHPFELPGIWLSAEELQALIACQHLLGNLAPGLLRNEIGQLRGHLEKLLDRSPGVKSPQLGRVKILSQAYRNRNDDLFLTLVQALFDQQKLLIHYHARGDDQTSRRPVSPQNIVLYKDNWYLDAYCHQREEPRTFALDRIKTATAIGEAAYLLDPDTLQQHFGSSYGIFAGKPKHTAILNFSAKAGRWVADECWHSQQECEWLADGRYQLRIPFNGHEELLLLLCIRKNSIKQNLARSVKRIYTMSLVYIHIMNTPIYDYHNY
ncbi:MAG: WYL domain-containing protein [Ignavibacteriales bacterium]|nr:WYL domain-containing protein [Ignavibacteriales bacterium]